MKTNVFLGIALRIIILFITGMAVTYVNPYLSKFLGDYYIKDYLDNWKLEWSNLHYWYQAMMIALFLLSLINVVASIVRLVKRNYDTTNWFK